MALDRLPVSAGDRPGELEVVLHRPAHEREERLGRRAGLLDEIGRRPVKRDEEALSHHRGRVVDETVLVVELEGPEPKQAGEPKAALRGLAGLSAADGRPGAVELLGPAVPDERLQRMEAEAAVCGSSASSVRAPLVCAIQGPAGIAAATSGTARSGTQRTTSSASRVSSSRPVSRVGSDSESRAATAVPTRPAPTTQADVNSISGSSSVGIPGTR